MNNITLNTPMLVINEAYHFIAAIMINLHSSIDITIKITYRPHQSLINPFAQYRRELFL
jgi:hypothetical protein